MNNQNQTISDILDPIEVGGHIFVEVDSKRDADVKTRQVTNSSRLRGDLKEREFTTLRYAAMSISCPWSDQVHLLKIMRVK